MELLVVVVAPKQFFFSFFRPRKLSTKEKRGINTKGKREKKKPGPWVGFYTFLKK
jgi:hypothetical protein